MTTTVIQANYPELEQIAQRFAGGADTVTTLLERVQGTTKLLTDGGWQGGSANAFFAEMDDLVLPGLRRFIVTLKTAQEVILAVKDLLRTAEIEAAARFKYSTKNGGSSTGTGAGGGGPSESFLEKYGVTLGMALWDTIRSRNALYAFFKGVRFVKDANGMWRLFGPDAAKKALGVSPSLTRFGEKAIEKSLSPFGFLRNLNGVRVGKGPFTARAANLFKSIFNAGPLATAESFKSQFKGAAILGGVIAFASNVYEFGCGANKDKGIFSSQFVIANVADISASVAITALAVGAQTLIPIPGVAIVVGLGLGLAYDAVGKDIWRGAVDQAAQYVQEQASRVPEQLTQLGRKIGYAAQDTTNQLEHQATQLGNQFQRTVNATSEVSRGALGGVGQFLHI